MALLTNRRFQLKFNPSFWGLFLVVLIKPLQGRGADATLRSPREYRLRFYHTHTNERLEIVYRRGERIYRPRWPSSTIFCATTVPGMFVTSTRACLTCCMTSPTLCTIRAARST